MNRIVKKEVLSKNTVLLEIEAPLIANSRKAGHFIIVKIGKEGERIPLTIVDSNIKKGTITIVVQQLGKSSRKISTLDKNDEITDLVGPLGKATNIDYFGTIICACGGIGVAPMFPILKEMKLAGNKVITILAARNKSLILFEKEVKLFSDETILMTDDGSCGIKGLITYGVENVLREKKIHLCITIGPPIMMKSVSILTKKYRVPTIASLNSLMIDGTGMCGACRISVGGKTKFVCVDGPEFNAHDVNFDEMILRLKAYDKYK